MKKNLVLVTGGSGFVGSHCLAQLLERGFEVRTSVRSLKKRDDVLSMMRRANVQALDHLAFFEADLMSDNGWDEAMRDCEYVLHVATPIPLALPKTEDEIIRPAVEGTLRVLKQAKLARVRRVVVTSSFAAIGYGNKSAGRPFDERDWTRLDAPGLSAYVKSKAMAERAAWDFMKSEGASMEMATINPMAIFGPLLGTTPSSGHQLLKQLFDGSMKRIPKIDFGIVDVRDVADLHIRAMLDPRAKGERFLALAGGTMTFQEIALSLKQEFGPRADKVPTRTVPDWLLRTLAIFSKKVRMVVPMLGQERNCSNTKAREVLGWDPRTNREAVIAAGASLLNSI